MNSIRFYQVKNVLKVITNIFLGAVIVLVAVQFLNLRNRIPSISAFAKNFNDISILINSAFTLLLLIVTGIYAWFTFLMMRAMSKQNLVSTTPIIFASVTYHKLEVNDSLLNFKIKLDILNCGTGAAINATYNYSIRKNIPPLHLDDYVMWSEVSDISSYFTSGSSYSKEIAFNSYITQLPKLIEEYLIIEISYIDVERNVYHINQYYNIAVDNFKDGTPFLYLYLKAEMAFMTKTTPRDWESNLKSVHNKNKNGKLLWKRSY